ncbi:preprotein translocase subunit YajC [Metallibacterium sp.]|uniref:preprotein translocase subunit YajC n=1 Tax=Metallibacterium sp. TaxID=2940281 RepID=UPI00260684E9|nr:preprotein translocase subunit YajC [Metallibacterium sp.]
MDFLIPSAHAAGTAPAANGGGGLQFIIMMVVLFGLMYFMMIRPQMKRQKELKKMISELAKGDEVITNGGLVGRIDAMDESFISLEVAPNVTVRIQRQAISAVLPKGTLKSS